MKKIKNNDSIAHTWRGQEVQPEEYYEIQPMEEMHWANDSQLLADIANTIAIVNNGMTNITDINEAINYLKSDLPKEVVTQFEKDDKILKLACAEANVSDGYAEVELKIPGTYANGTGRYVDAGRVWFDIAHTGDKVISVKVMDKDGVFGYGPNILARVWHDEELDEINQGWYIPKNTNGLTVDSMGGYGFIPSGLYLQIKAVKGENQTTGVLYLNLKWGKQE